MTVTIGRRELLAALGGAAVAWPRVACAQQPANLPTIGSWARPHLRRRASGPLPLCSDCANLAGWRSKPAIPNYISSPNRPPQPSEFR